MAEIVTRLSAQRGVRLAFDWGRARVGVAACDPEGVLAYPVETIDACANPWTRVVELVGEYQPVEVVLGWPRNLAGREGPAVQAMRAIQERLVELVRPIPVVLVDERMSTAEASRRLMAAGKDSRARRGIIDQVAAVGILESALDQREVSP